ncbi:MAG: MotA/TolQ/ExbB proton channel family protein [bacterium]
MFDSIVKGGYCMIPIILCSIISLAITIERFFSLRDEKIHPEEFVAKVKKLLTRDKIDEAVSLCNTNNSPIAKILEAGIFRRHKNRDKIKEAIEHAGRQEANKLQRYLPALSIISSIAPSLGLLGTVFGMIKAFEVIYTVGIGEPAALSKGISEALITTAAGLLVAIPTVVIYGYFYKKSNNYILEMEDTSMELLDMLTEE